MLIRSSMPESWRAAPLLLALVPLSACVSYEPEPIDARELFLQLADDTAPLTSEHRRLDVQQLLATAEHCNPSLATAEARVVAARLAAEAAGLPPEIAFGWDAMGALAVELTGGSATSVDFLAGLSLELELPRPGELAARRKLAALALAASEAELTDLRWRTRLELRRALAEFVAARERLFLQERRQRLANDAEAYFERARKAGTVTGLPLALVRVEARLAEAGTLELEAALGVARRAVLDLLGAAPDRELELALDWADLMPTGLAASELVTPPTPAFVAERLGLDPGLALALVEYARSEAELELAAARTWPQLSLGTVVGIVPGFLGDFGRPAVRAAEAQRELALRSVEQALHASRRDLHAAAAGLAAARREVDWLESRLLPEAESVLATVEASFDAGEVTLVEILESQEALFETRRLVLDARLGEARSAAEYAARALPSASVDESPGAPSPDPETNPSIEVSERAATEGATERGNHADV